MKVTHHHWLPYISSNVWYAGMAMWGSFFSWQNTPEGCTETHKSSFSPYIQLIRKNGVHEWLRMTNAIILCDLLWKGEKSDAEESFNNEANSRYAMVMKQIGDMDGSMLRALKYLTLVLFIMYNIKLTGKIICRL